MKEKESWAWVEGFNKYYSISDHGRVKSYHNARHGWRKKGQLMNLFKDKNGYLYIILHLQGKYTHFAVERLVAIHFIPNPENKPQVNHKDGIHNNNRYKNLEWVTASENRKHARDILCVQFGVRGEKHTNAKLKGKQVMKIKELHKYGLGATEISRIFNVSPGCITGILRGNNWRCLL